MYYAGSEKMLMPRLATSKTEPGPHRARTGEREAGRASLMRRLLRMRWSRLSDLAVSEPRWPFFPSRAPVTHAKHWRKVRYWPVPDEEREAIMRAQWNGNRLSWANKFAGSIDL